MKKLKKCQRVPIRNNEILLYQKNMEEITKHKDKKRKIIYELDVLYFIYSSTIRCASNIKSWLLIKIKNEQKIVLQDLSLFILSNCQFKLTIFCIFL